MPLPQDHIKIAHTIYANHETPQLIKQTACHVSTHPSNGEDFKDGHFFSPFLRLPSEIRLFIYGSIQEGIRQAAPRNWHQLTTSVYDGIRFVCWQLYRETEDTIFQFRATQYNIGRVCNIPTNRIHLENARSLCLEISHTQVPQICAGLAATIDNVQQSLQELKLAFVGRDAAGSETGMSDCGNSLGLREDAPILQSNAQHGDSLLILWRRITILKNLRLLVIKNANCPVFQSMLIADKPDLECIWIETDPRSALHKFDNMQDHPRTLRNLMTHSSRTLPHVKALHLGANAVLGAIQVVNKVMPTLEHLTWISPRESWQPFDSVIHSGRYRDASWCHGLGQLFNSIRLRGNKLRHLRLCYHMKSSANLSSGEWSHRGYFIETLISHVSSLSNLRALEVHASNSCIRGMEDFILSLPNSLRRLYVADTFIDPEILIDAVEKRYWIQRCPTETTERKIHEEGMSYSLRLTTRDKNHQNPAVVRISINDIGLVSYNAEASEIGSNNGSIGAICLENVCTRLIDGTNPSLDYCTNAVDEHCMSCTHIKLSKGELGFVGFEYNTSITEELRLRILKMNGRLLDRERNLHLLAQERRIGYCDVFDYSIPPPLFALTEVEPSADEDQIGQETAVHSDNLNIASALYSLNFGVTYSLQNLCQNKNNLETCGLTDTWLFGTEGQAMCVFDNEPVAKVGNIKIKSTILDIPLTELENNRCHWNSTEYRVDPIGSWPLPKLPKVIEKGITEDKIH